MRDRTHIGFPACCIPKLQSHFRQPTGSPAPDVSWHCKASLKAGRPAGPVSVSNLLRRGQFPGFLFRLPPCSDYSCFLPLRVSERTDGPLREPVRSLHSTERTENPKPGFVRSVRSVAQSAYDDTRSPL